VALTGAHCGAQSSPLVIVSPVEWLLVIGISFELAGAALLAWTIYSRSAAGNREEAVSVLGSNFWIIVFRDREQAYVRAGLGEKQFANGAM
jgi:hypothetical protein